MAAHALAVALVLLSREDLALPVAGLGAVLALRAEARAAGLLTVPAAAAALVVNVGVVLPAFAPDYTHASLLSAYDGSLPEVAAFVLTHPLEVLGDLVRPGSGVLLVQLLGPVLALPLLAPRWLLPAVPLQVLLLLSTRADAHTMDSKYVTQAVPFVAVATAVGLGRLGGLARRPPLRRLPAVVAVALVATSATGFLLLARDSPFGGSVWEPTNTARVQAVERAAALVPDDAAVSATDRIAPLLAARQDVSIYPTPFFRGEDPGTAPSGSTHTARETDWLVLEGDSPVLADFPLPPGFTVVERSDVVVVAVRDGAAPGQEGGGLSPAGDGRPGSAAPSARP